MKRTFMAMPPRPAGATLLAKEEATWAAPVGPMGSRFGTEPSVDIVAAR